VKEIVLQGGKIALVDDADFETVRRLKWRVHQSKNTFYVTTGHKPALPLHRFLLKPLPDQVVDHVNGDGLDNRRENLRACTQLDNMKNQRRHADSRSPFKGIWWSKDCRKWAAQIYHAGKRKYLGLFAKPEDAAKAYDAKARELFGPFARLNFPEAA
jgi:hypothetical protein